MTTITIQTPAIAGRPSRGSLWASRAARAVQTWLTAPAAPVRTERAAEAAAVREYARRYAQHDPRFAADLLAAADRHEAGL